MRGPYVERRNANLKWKSFLLSYQNSQPMQPYLMMVQAIKGGFGFEVFLDGPLRWLRKASFGFSASAGV